MSQFAAISPVSSASSLSGTNQSTGSSSTLLSLENLHPSPAPGLASAPPLKTYGTPLRDRVALSQGLKIVTSFSASNLESRPPPYAGTDATIHAKGAVQPTRANLPRRRVAKKAATVPAVTKITEELPSEPQAAPASTAATAGTNTLTDVVPTPPPAEPLSAPTQPPRARLPRRKAARKTFAMTPEDEEREALPTPPADDGASCLQPVGARFAVAFADGDSAPAGAFAHVVSVHADAPRRGRPRVARVPVHAFADDAGVRRLRLGAGAGAPLAAEQLAAAHAFVRAAPPGARVLVTAPGLRPGDAMAVVALCVAAARPADAEAATIARVLQEIDEDERVMGFWKGVVDVDLVDVAQGVLDTLRGGVEEGPARVD